MHEIQVWPIITEQNRIVDRQCSLSTSGKSTRIPWFISFPTSAHWGRSTEWWARYWHVCKTTFATPMEKGKKKLTKKQLYSLSVTDSLSSLSVSCGRRRAPARARMVKCQSSPIMTAMALMLMAVTTIRSTQPCGSNSTDSHPSTKALCHHRIVESSNVSFPNASFNNVVISLGENLITQHYPADTSIFSEYSAMHCLTIHECSASTLAFFLSSRRLLYTSAPMFSCILSAKKIVFLSARAQSFAVGVHQHAFR